MCSAVAAKLEYNNFHWKIAIIIRSANEKKIIKNSETVFNKRK